MSLSKCPVSKCRIGEWLHTSLYEILYVWHYILCRLRMYLIFCQKIWVLLPFYKLNFNTTIMYRFLVQYTLEYVLRLWSCGCHGRFKGYMGRLKFARRFFSILDLTTLLITALVFFESIYMTAKNPGEPQSESRLLATSVLRALRFLQVVRMIRVDRRYIAFYFWFYQSVKKTLFWGPGVNVLL